jgi:hypothetical protein
VKTQPLYEAFSERKTIITVSNAYFPASSDSC